MIGRNPQPEGAGRGRTLPAYANRDRSMQAEIWDALLGLPALLDLAASLGLAG
jgi:hypothetical protein